MVRFAVAAIALVTSLVGPTVFGSQILLLDFSTANCRPCREMEPLIHAFEQAGYPIRKIDATREPQVAQQYNVTGFPTFVMLVDGREIQRIVGATDSEKLQQMFRQARDTVVASQRRQSPTEQKPAANGPHPDSPAAGDPSHDALLRSSVRLRVDDGKYRSFGTGTIIDSREGEALVITCGHLFRDSKGKNSVSVEMFESTNGQVRPAGQASGWVLSYDLDRDVALVVFRPGRTIPAAAIAAPGTAIERGDRVVSIGCSNGDDPTALSTRITMLDRYQGAPNIEASGAPVEGRSGGGLFNDKGELIGICNAADYEGNEGLYAALDSIHDEIARLDLRSKQNRLAQNDSTAPAAPSRDRPGSLVPIVRAQNELPAESIPHKREPASSLTATTIGPNNLSSEQPAGLNQVEQAAWEEIVKRSAQSEVIIIVRPKEPGAQSEVITLENASPEFIRAVAGRQRDSQSPVVR